MTGDGSPAPLFPTAIRLNPGTEKAEQDMWQWLDEFGLCRSPEARANVRRSRVAYCIGLYYPSAHLDVLVLITRFTGWSLLIDEEFDAGPARNDPGACLSAVTALLAPFTTAPAHSPARTEPSDRGGHRAMADAAAHLWGQLAPIRSPAWTSRFRAHLANWLWGFYGETVDRAVHRLPEPAEYHERRREMFGVPWYLDLCEVACAVDLPDAVHRLPAFRTLYNAVCDTTALCNDRVSADRERATGYLHNAVTILEHHRGWTPRKAAAHVDRMIVDGADLITAAHRDLPRQLDQAGLPRASIADALRCADAYLDVVRGNHSYHHTSARYTGLDSLPPGGCPAEGFARNSEGSPS
ncbi:terpene synthase family protein [Kitasatospora sp. NPDC127059]|uniref:terpene synthase family protein n=1 Tax=unclassified Kitasatospora TaxID=2633591 RepID=UPI00365A57ED